MNDAIKRCTNCGGKISKRSRQSWEQWFSQKFCSYACRAARITPFHKGHKVNLGRKQTAEHKASVGLSQKDERSHFWKGGVTKESALIRGSAKYKEWRTKVFEKYGYRCIGCGAKGYIQADHIFPFAYFPRLRLDINNGQVLCVDCHKQTPTYAQKARSLYE